MPGGNTSGTAIRASVGFAQVAALGAVLAGAVTIGTLPPGAQFKSCKIKHSVAFAGGAIATMTVSVGIAGSVAKFGAAFNIFTSNPPSDAAAGKQLLATPSLESDVAPGTPVIATFTATVGNLNALTQGALEIWIEYQDMPAASVGVG